MMEDHDARLSALEARIAHVDERGNTTATQVATIDAKVDAIAATLDNIVTTVNRPHTTNWVGVGGLLLTMAIVGGGFVGLRLLPLDKDIAHLTYQVRHLDEMHHKTQDNVSELQQLAAALEEAKVQEEVDHGVAH